MYVLLSGMTVKITFKPHSCLDYTFQYGVSSSAWRL